MKNIRLIWILICTVVLMARIFFFDGKPISYLWDGKAPSYFLDGKTLSDVEVSLFMIMAALTFPSGLIFYFSLFFVIYSAGSIVTVSYSSIILTWLGCFAIGYVQWFILVPKLVRLFTKKNKTKMDEVLICALFALISIPITVIFSRGFAHNVFIYEIFYIPVLIAMVFVGYGTAVSYMFPIQYLGYFLFILISLKIFRKLKKTRAGNIAIEQSKKDPEFFMLCIVGILMAISLIVILISFIF